MGYLVPFFLNRINIILILTTKLIWYSSLHIIFKERNTQMTIITSLVAFTKVVQNIHTYSALVSCKQIHDFQIWLQAADSNIPWCTLTEPKTALFCSAWQQRHYPVGGIDRYLMFYTQSTTKGHMRVRQKVLLPQVPFSLTMPRATVEAVGWDVAWHSDTVKTQDRKVEGFNLGLGSNLPTSP